MEGKEKHDLLNLVNALSSAQFNILMLTCQRGGGELRKKIQALCSTLLKDQKTSEDLRLISQDLIELLDRTKSDQDLIASELDRMEQTLESLKKTISSLYTK